MGNILSYTFIVISLLSSYTWANAGTTLSGLPYKSQLHFTIEKACVLKNITLPKGGDYLPEPTISVGMFRAEFDLAKKIYKLNEISLENFKNIPLSEFKSTITTNALGNASEYTFENFSFSVPFDELELTLSDLRMPFIVNNPISGLYNAAFVEPTKTIQTLGFYVQMGDVTSLVSFVGDQTHIAENLKKPDSDGQEYYFKIWPQIATLLRDENNVYVNAKEGHLSYNTELICGHKNYIKYSVELER